MSNPNPVTKNTTGNGVNSYLDGLDIIWNISTVCPWDCDICCVDAVHITRDKDRVKIRSDGLIRTDYIERDRNLSIYDQAERFRQDKSLELTLEEKLRVIDHLEGSRRVKLDFSGGDPLVCSDNLEAIRCAAQKFGRENLGISTTGAGLSMKDPEELIPYISKMEFTYDNADGRFDPIRPMGYNNQNLRRASLFRREGLRVKALMPLHMRNTEEGLLRLLYENLHHAGIDVVEPMRYFPVGRGFGKTDGIPTKEQYMKAIETLMDMETKLGSPIVKLQCALKGLYDTSGVNPCNLYREGLGLTSRGILLTDAWAIGPRGEPLDDAFVLGSLVDNHVDELLNNERGKQYWGRLDENSPHCKIFAYLHSGREDSLERLFDESDPLYVGDRIE